jgi:hypothetical protein
VSCSVIARKSLRRRSGRIESFVVWVCLSPACSFSEPSQTGWLGQSRRRAAAIYEPCEFVERQASDLGDVPECVRLHLRAIPPFADGAAALVHGVAERGVIEQAPQRCGGPHIALQGPASI